MKKTTKTRVIPDRVPVTTGIFERQKPADGYDLKLCVRAAYAHLQGQAAGRGSPDDSRVLSSARARQATAGADKVELANAIARGEYVPLDLFMKKSRKCSATAASAFCRSPARPPDRAAVRDRRSRCR